ncbi:MAG TPA: VOC family protein [Terricaulis sp.]|nr:VOC family protein [Terricaulis sp.]
MTATLGMLTLVVREYDEAITYFTGALGFELIEDTRMSAEKRWVVVGAEGGARLLLAKAANEAQAAAIGNQTGGRVFLFLYTPDFDATYARYLQAGVRFIETPRQEAYGKVVVFEDLYGNRWDLIERQ